jgi:hypothetical protein
MKGRVTLLTVLLMLASSMTAYGAVGLTARTTTCSHCGTLGAVHGSGVLRQTGTGVTYGTVGQGTIAKQIHDLFGTFRDRAGFPGLPPLDGSNFRPPAPTDGQLLLF